MVHLGPAPDVRGGMPAVLRAILESPLSERYRLEVIPTWRPFGPVRRLVFFLVAVVRLGRWCLGRGQRLVHVHTTVRGSLYRKSVCVCVAKLLRRRTIMHIHSGAGDIEAFLGKLGPARRAVFRYALKLADSVVSVSAAGARAVEMGLGVSGIAVVPNAAPRVAGPPDHPGEANPKASGRGRAIHLLFLGGFANPAKGGSILLNALPQIVSMSEDVLITLAGPGQPPAAALDAIGADGRVRWAGWLDEDAKAELFACSDVFLLPSVSEGLPIALLEAMAHGQAIVATQVGGIPEILTDGVDALLVPGGDPARLRDAVLTLAGDARLRERIGGAARARAERWGEEEVCSRLDALYRMLAA